MNSFQVQLSPMFLSIAITSALTLTGCGGGGSASSPVFTSQLEADKSSALSAAAPMWEAPAAATADPLVDNSPMQFPSDAGIALSEPPIATHGSEMASTAMAGATSAPADLATAITTVVKASAAPVGSTGVGNAPSVTTARTASTASTVTLAGNGVPGVYAAGCSRVIGSDYIDTTSWTNRRLEPRDCAVVYLSTPVFSWTQPADRNNAIAWKFVLRQSTGAVIAERTSTKPRLLLADITLPSGSYTWTVSYTNTRSQVLTSQARRFVVANTSGLTKLMSGAAFADIAITKARPKTLPNGASLAGVVASAKSGEYNASFSAFLAQADKIMLQTPAPVPEEIAASTFASAVDYNNWLMQLRNQAGAERVAIETLGYTALFTGDSRYEQAGITRLLSLAAWPTDGATSEANQDQANREIYLALGLGLDLYQTKLTSAQRNTIVAALKDRITQASSKFYELNNWPYDSHLLTATQYVTEALIYAAGTPEFPEARDWLAVSWETWITTLGTWGGGDGGYGNSGAYGWYSMTLLPRGLAIAKLAAGLDLSQWPVVGKFGDNQIAFTPAAARLRGQFGDEAEISGHYFNYAFDAFRLYASVTGKPEYEWYWRASDKNISLPVALSPLHYMLLGFGNTRATPAAPTATSWVFEDAGLVAMHSSSADPLRSSVFFRSSRLGSFNHSHADNNAITFVSKGHALLISGGYTPYFGSPHHRAVARATRFKNALTFDGGIGQAEPTSTPSVPGNPVESMDTRGELINFADDGRWAVTTGDATLAYRGQNTTSKAWSPLLTNAVRSVAYQRSEKVVVVYDWATSTTARSWELNFQAPTLPTLAAQTVRIDSNAASACIDVYGLSGSFKLSSGFPIAPETPMPDQFHARYAVSSPSSQLVAVTVIREDCRAVAVKVSISGTSASVSINGGVAIVVDRKTVKVPAAPAL